MNTGFVRDLRWRTWWRTCLQPLANASDRTGFVHDRSFVRKYLDETTLCILPHAEQVNPDMFRELSDLVQSRSLAT